MLLLFFFNKHIWCIVPGISQRLRPSDDDHNRCCVPCVAALLLHQTRICASSARRRSCRARVATLTRALILPSVGFFLCVFVAWYVCPSVGLFAFFLYRLCICLLVRLFFGAFFWFGRRLFSLFVGRPRFRYHRCYRCFCCFCCCCYRYYYCYC